MLLYAFAICLSAFLLFQVQPMIAKMILPWFGGSAAVWITCMLFFQVGLLCGYIYAHWSIRTLTPKIQTALHAVLLGISLLFLPMMPASTWKPMGSGDPIVRILGLLSVTVGLPYFLLSATSPLLQAWYAKKYREALPYKLFALSNLFSLLGLLAYPFLIETQMTIPQQSLSWSLAYGGFVILGLGVAGISSRGQKEGTLLKKEATQTSSMEDSPPTSRDFFVWFVFSYCSSTLFLSVTNHLTQNIAPIPFLWILPLSLYLLSFILCFDYETLYRRDWYVWLIFASLTGLSYGLVSWHAHTNLKLVIPVFSVCLFLCCMFCHGELVKRKPDPKHLTSFYLMVAIGGAAGGVFVGLIAPKVFPGYFELPVGLSICVLLLFFVNYRRWWVTDVTNILLVVFVLLGSGYSIFRLYKDTRFLGRNFYGSLSVKEHHIGRGDEYRMLLHGTVLHGVQYMRPERAQMGLTYFSPRSGVGLALKQSSDNSPLKVGIIGLGTGTLAIYARPGDLFRFYEINPLVEDLARREFFYLSNSRGKVEVVLGDGRISLEQEPDQNYDLLVVDAFSGESIPVHLLTVEAMKLYFRHLKSEGVLAIHISNVQLNLEPVIEKLRLALNKDAVLISNKKDDGLEINSADWALITSNKNFLEATEIKKVARSLQAKPDLRVWTDDYNNLFQVLK
jgi:hypothetical protein